MKRSNCYFFEHFIRQVFEGLFGQKITEGLGGGAPQKLDFPYGPLLSLWAISPSPR